MNQSQRRDRPPRPPGEGPGEDEASEGSVPGSPPGRAEPARRATGGDPPPATKVLVVDDLPTNVALLSRALAAEGYEVLAALSGPRALELAERARPDIILLDLVMPGMDGLEVCRRLKAAPENHPVPIIIVSACGDEEQVVRALDAGAHDYITKPLNYRMAMARIRSAVRAKAAHDLIVEMNARLADLATRDGLTGVRNHRHFCSSLEAASSFASRHGLPLSLVMLDVDHFKAFNDGHGHPAGDRVLCAVADVLRGEIRAHDVLARYGGEEFAILLPATEAAASLDMAERLRAALAGFPWPLRAITASFGVATACPPLTASPPLLARADKALYHSKRLGRNRVTHYDAMISAPDGAASRIA